MRRSIDKCSIKFMKRFIIAILDFYCNCFFYDISIFLNLGNAFNPCNSKYSEIITNRVVLRSITAVLIIISLEIFKISEKKINIPSRIPRDPGVMLTKREKLAKDV